MDTKLAYTPVTQVYGHNHGSQYIVLPYCTGGETRSVPNVALRLPHKTAIQCSMGCLGKLFPLPLAIGGGVGGALARGWMVACTTTP